MHRVRLCEPVCPSKGLTLSPRQRIVIWRDIQAKKRAGVDTTELEAAYHYQGIETCAATGLCAQRCPVGINTGDLVKKLRSRDADRTKTAEWLATHFATALQGARFTLHVANGARMLLGAPRLAKLSATVTKLSKGQIPQWTNAMPQPERAIRFSPPVTDERPRVVYLAACVSRTMGPAAGDKEQMSLYDKTRSLLEKAGYQVVFPDNQDSLCCGQPFASKGYAEQAEHKRQELIGALLHASRGGLDPIYCDTSPCTLRLVQDLANTRLDLYDPVRFIRTHLMDRLDFTPQDADRRACHLQHPAPGRKPGADRPGPRCSNTVVIPGRHSLLRLCRRQGLHHAATQRPLTALPQGRRAVLAAKASPPAAPVRSA